MHLRHMVAGRNINVENERIYRFDMPERPGALLKFLVSEDSGLKHGLRIPQLAACTCRTLSVQDGILVCSITVLRANVKAECLLGCK